MNVSVWYVYLDEEGEWLTDAEHGDGSDNWHDAKEFREESDAQSVAERHGGVVFAWCQ
jgi:hypothetical protein